MYIFRVRRFFDDFLFKSFQHPSSSFIFLIKIFDLIFCLFFIPVFNQYKDIRSLIDFSCNSFFVVAYYRKTSYFMGTYLHCLFHFLNM